MIELTSIYLYEDDMLLMNKDKDILLSDDFVFGHEVPRLIVKFPIKSKRNLI